MFRVEDAAGGEPVAIVCGAAQLPLPLTVGRLALGRQVRVHLRESRAKSVLRTVDEAGGTQIWWAGLPGVSVAAAIDEWSEAGRRGAGADAGGPGDDDGVVVAFDEQVYFAARAGGLVVEEWVVGGARASRKLDEWATAGRPIRAFAAGRQRDLVDAAAPCAELPFDLGRYRYGTPLAVFARRGLFHPAFAAAALLAVAVPGIAWTYSEQAQRAAAAVREDVRLRQIAMDEMQADFGGGTLLVEFAALVSGDAMLALHRDGMGRVEYLPGGNELRIRGGRPGGFPTAARAYAERVGGAFTFAGGSWEIVQGVGSVPAYGAVDGVRVDELAAAVFDAGRGAGADVAMGSRTDFDRTAEMGFRLAMPRANPGDLARLGAALAARPVALESVACTYGGWRMEQCEVQVRAKGLSG